MARYKCRRPITLQVDGKKIYYHTDEVFEATEPAEWLAWAVKVRVIFETDEPTTGPGRDARGLLPSVPRLREDGTFTDPEPETEEIE